MKSSKVEISRLFVFSDVLSAAAAAITYVAVEGGARHAALAARSDQPGDSRHVDPDARLLRGGGDAHRRSHGGVS